MALTHAACMLIDGTTLASLHRQWHEAEKNVAAKQSLMRDMWTQEANRRKLDFTAYLDLAFASQSINRKETRSIRNIRSTIEAFCI